MKKSIFGHKVPPPKRIHVAPYLYRNTAIVPASQLKAIKQWQQRANQLPNGETLLVLPAGNGRMQIVGQRIRVVLDRQGRQVTIATVR